MMLSESTRKLVAEMASKSGLTAHQRRMLSQKLDAGEALPAEGIPPSAAPARPPSQPALLPASAVCTRKKVLPEILREGIYTTERVAPRPGRDRTVQADRLQRFMEHTGSEKDILANVPAPPRPQPEPEPQMDRFDELVREVEERRQFMADMTRLGRGKEVEGIVKAEIRQKLAEMEALQRAAESRLHG
ncbi:putative UPF0193 protein EVG1 [Paratrimastix pyriformis]|uniref:UPF0193 protein EVG1 n=1 Tax=Paratrimastix pyriformis TaxID=342808 RepID=A0ABQ8UH03_9EUKA|nr:putative UPF0193 protein EVG1 [Paratrimastix pyriformis]